MPAIKLSSNEMKNLLKNTNVSSINKRSENGGDKTMKNKLTDLNNHLFEQLERLNNEDLSEEELEKEIKRTKAMTNVATNIINNGNLMLNTMKFMDENSYTVETEIKPGALLGLTDEKI